MVVDGRSATVNNNIDAANSRGLSLYNSAWVSSGGQDGFCWVATSWRYCEGVITWRKGCAGEGGGDVAGEEGATMMMMTITLVMMITTTLTMMSITIMMMIIMMTLQRK